MQRGLRFCGRVADGVRGARLLAYLGWLGLLSSTLLLGCPSPIAENPSGLAAGADADDGGLRALSDLPASSDEGNGVDQAAAACPGGDRCPCSKPDECDGGRCLETADGSICAASCLGNGVCLPGEVCKDVSTGADSIEKICVPRWASLCSPCLSNADCKSTIALDGLVCASQGAEGHFCSAVCGVDTTCPAGFFCDSNPANGGPPHCVPKSGICACSAWAVAHGSSTDCANTNVAGTCTAKRSCAVVGPLPECAAAIASKELCNGKDDNCDGQIDEDTVIGCSDGDACTTDLCTGGKCASFNATECGDGTCADQCGESAATCAVDCHTCGDGTCSPGESPKNCKEDCCGSCGDGLCKGYECGEDKGITLCALDCGVACGNGKCDKGESPVTCAADCQKQICGNNVCEVDDGGPTQCPGDCANACGNCQCDKGESPDSCPMDCGFCGDGTCSLCSTMGETAKLCPADCGDLKLIGCTLAWGLFCMDDTPCTADSCQSGKGCVHLPVDSTCTDGNACTADDQCKGYLCAAGPTVPCTDGNACTTDACDPVSGCVFPPADGLLCNDGSVCSIGDTCKDGACAAGPPMNCNDQNPCTTDACDAIAGCQHAANTEPCPDSNKCTTGKTCVASQCTPGSAVICNDNNPCTDDSCAPTSGCVYQPNAAGCSDGDACTDNDKCAGGACGAGTAKNCNDGKPCTSDTCSKTSGCSNTNTTASCDDGNACTKGDKCSGGACTAGPAANCDDGNVCTTDSCAPLTGCANPANSLSCSDGNACTSNDKCNAGQCVGSVVNCDDGKVCTNDSCSSTSGCVHTNNTAGCNDNNGCTSNDKCASGTCSGTAVLTCPSGWGGVKAGGKCSISSVNSVILKDTPNSVLANWKFPYSANSGIAAMTNLTSEWVSGGCLNWDFLAVKLTCNKATIQLPNTLMGLDSPGFPKSYTWTGQGLGESCSISQFSNGWTPVFYPICTRRMTFHTTWTLDAKCSW